MLDKKSVDNDCSCVNESADNKNNNNEYLVEEKSTSLYYFSVIGIIATPLAIGFYLLGTCLTPVDTNGSSEL